MQNLRAKPRITDLRPWFRIDALRNFRHLFKHLHKWPSVVRGKFVSTALGASGSMAGILSISKCSGNVCTSCFGCAGGGIGILLLVLFSKMKANKKEENNGMAKRDR
jgi:hypothetical protein